MCKKILIAAVAVVAGLAVINHSLVKVWWKGACCTVKGMVPPEVRLNQLNAEIDNIDKDIKTNLGNLARMEVQTEKLKKQLDGMNHQKEKLAASMEGMEKSLEARSETVVFRGHSVRKRDLVGRLDTATADYKILAARIKTQEQLVQEKKRNLEAMLNRIQEMRHQKDKLRLLSARLEHQLEIVKMKQMEARVAGIDDGAVIRCQQIADEVETYLREKEAETRLQKDFGYGTPESGFDKEPKSVEEVLKASRQARQQEKDEVETVAADKDGK